jgi:hypothetical protein
MNLEILDKCLSDKSTIYKHHTTFTHLFCVFLRIIIGLVLIFYKDKLNKKYIIILFSILSLAFLLKFINVCLNNINIWKVYLRTFIVYGLGSYLVYSHKCKDAGLLIIIDALMGLQSRHLSSAIIHCVNKK